jgi:hypothetical protein
MNEFYPYDSPIIMTDTIFTTYGGSKDYTSSAQRTLAYWLAEQKASQDLHTFLLPTMITGSYHYKSRIELEHTYLRSVARVDYINAKGDVYWSVTGTNNWYVSIWNSDYGRIDVSEFLSYCGCVSPHGGNPYELRIAYEAGLPTGVANHPDILLGLTIYSEIVLNEITGFGNESPGNASIESFKNQQYFEKRRGLFNTVFGGSPRSLFVYNLFSRLRKRKHVGL